MTNAKTALTPAPPPVTSQLVEFTISDQLGEGQMRDEINVIIDGKSVGALKASLDDPAEEMLVTVPTAGQHSYTILSKTLVDINGTPTVVEGTGQGTIQVEQGKRYHVTCKENGSMYLLTLLEEQ